uniref:hypothetical protein n=1 Tax=Comamonas testosteroni TaxID=285 RepID=UPI0015F7D9B8|nr:hypothetical protein [Comamonas testosteroni]
MSGRRLIRQIKAGESLSFDGGRVVVTLRQRTGQRAELSLHLEDDVVVDKPTHARGDEPRGHKPQHARGLAPMGT